MTLATVGGIGRDAAGSSALPDVDQWSHLYAIAVTELIRSKISDRLHMAEEDIRIGMDETYPDGSLGRARGRKRSCCALASDTRTFTAMSWGEQR